MANNYVPTSNIRSTSRTTRTNPTRTSKTNGSNLRQNSLTSYQPPSVQGGPEPHGFYPAIQYFTDAVSAIPREFRRHASLLKEVDAKAWQPEENLQILLKQCNGAHPTLPPQQALAYSAAPSTVNPGDDTVQISSTNGTDGVGADGASQTSTTTPSLQRRQLFAALRHNLTQIMHTMDEKNHVINNANEEMTHHIRRLNTVWPHIADEISEEARLGSLKHWALSDLNPPKKGTTAGSSRRDANLAIMHENEVAQRSESRREAVAAKSRQRLDRQAQLDSGSVEPRSKKRTIAREDTRGVDSASEVPGLGTTAAKGKKRAGGAAMEKTLSAIGGRAMSREPSQQEGSKKRKAPAGSAAVARKRVNAAADSPKLASSPLASTFPKDAYKRSPALAAARPVSARARQNSTQNEPGRAKGSAAAQRTTAGNGPTAPNSTNRAGNGKGAKGMFDHIDNIPDLLVGVEKALRDVSKSSGSGSKNNEAGNSTKASAALTSKARDADAASARGANSPRLSNAGLDRGGRGRASKTGTPVVGTFSEAETFASNGTAAALKARRAPRARPKYEGLHDSLSPKGLPPKRLHKKSGSITTLGGLQGPGGPARLKEESSVDGRLQRTNSGESGRSGNATPVDAEVSDEEESTAAEGGRSHARPSSHTRRQRSRQKSTQSKSRAGKDGASGRRNEIDSADDDDVDMDVDGDLEADAEVRDGAKDGTVNSIATGPGRELAESPDPAEWDDTGLHDGDHRYASSVPQGLAAGAGRAQEVDADEGDGDGEADEDDEERYCYCQMGSYGEMVACDNDDCAREWFHLDCIGLKSVPKSAKWYCEECKLRLVEQGRS